MARYPGCQLLNIINLSQIFFIMFYRMKKSIFLALLLLICAWVIPPNYAQGPSEDQGQPQESLALEQSENEIRNTIQQKVSELNELSAKISELTERLDSLQENELDTLLKAYESEEKLTSELESLEKNLMEVQVLRESNNETFHEVMNEGKNFQVADIGIELIWIESLNFWVSKYEITNGEYRHYDPNHISGEYEGYNLNDDRQPVVYISYEDALSFAQWLTVQERAAGRLPPNLTFRLPTAEEWIKIAECGDQRRYPWGNVWPPLFGNYDDDTLIDDYIIDDYKDDWIVSSPVEESGCNNWGVCGLGGNVLEWTDEVDHLGFAALGGSWAYFNRNTLECKFRTIYPPDIRFESLGFRLVLSR